MPFLYLLLLAATALVLTQGAADDCKNASSCISKDTTGPPALSGAGGDGRDYDFRHTADVNESGSNGMRKYVYEHEILNRHSQRALWAEWQDGNMPFQLIDPCGCASSYRESTIEWKENPNSSILYGQNRQFPDTASAYLTQTQSKTVSPAAKLLPPPLITRLSARVVVNQERVAVNVAFVTSALPESRFSYTIESKSSRDVLFRLAALTTRWSQFVALDQALQASDWKTVVKDDHLFLLRRDRIAAWTIAAPASMKEFREETAEIKIFSEGERTLLGSGFVSVYLPAPRRTPIR